MTNLSQVVNVHHQTMSSLEIAELTGKRHDNVLTDIRKMLSELEISTPDFTGVYINQQGKKQPCFNLPIQIANLLLDKYKGLSRVPNRLQEEAALKTIEQLLSITLIRQYAVDGFRIDGYDPVNNVAYEIDESGHKYKYNKDITRQNRIEKLLKCKFVRIKL